MTNSISESYNSKHKNSIYNIIFSSKYNLSDKSTLDYNFTYTPFTSKGKEFINNTQVFDNHIQKSNSLLGSQLSYNNSLSDQLLFSLTLHHDQKNDNTNLNLTSDNEYLNINFLDNNFSSYHTNHLQNQFYKITSAIYYKKSDNRYSLKSFYSNSKNRFSTQIDGSVVDKELYYNALSRTTKMLVNEFRSVNKLNKFRFDNSIALVNYQITDNKNHSKSTPSKIEAQLSGFYDITSNNTVKLSYSKVYNEGDISKMVDNYYVFDYKTVIMGEDLDKLYVYSKNSIGLHYTHYNTKNSEILNFNIDYSYSNRSLSNHYLYQNYYTYNKLYQFGKIKELSTLLIYDRTLKFIPYSIKSSLSFTHETGENRIDTYDNIFTNNRIIGKLNFYSAFKNSLFQTEIGYIYDKIFSKQQFQNISNDLTNQSLFFTIKGNFFNKKLNYNLVNKVLLQKLNDKNQFVFILSPSMYYEVSKFLTLNIKTDNILNLNHYENLTESNTDYYAETNQIKMLPGYILFGATLSF